MAADMKMARASRLHEREKKRKPGWYSEGRCRYFRNYRIADVFVPGKVPRGHPRLFRGPRGAPRLQAGQVWAEVATDYLWQIRWLEPGARGKFVVTLRPYRCRSAERTLSERALRTNMHVWEDALEFRRESMRLLREAIKRGEGNAFGLTDLESAAAYFGQELFTGFRTDD